MKRFLNVCAVALTLSALATVYFVGTVTAASSRPSVTLLGVSPLKVGGTGFGSRASVRVKATWSGRTAAKTVRASTTGQIAVAFPASLTVVACRTLRLDALAANGRIASWRPGAKGCTAIAMPVTPLG
jgi:hypothetical protein